LREYVAILKSLLHEGSVDFDGRWYHAHTQVASQMSTPVMISALRERGFRLGGEISDGVIPWLCPWTYLQQVALPNIAAGAKQAGRQPPPLIAPVSVCVHDDAAEVREAARQQFDDRRSVPYYRAMF